MLYPFCTVMSMILFRVDTFSSILVQETTSPFGLYSFYMIEHFGRHHLFTDYSGGKETDFEGGIRAVTFVTGGFLPEHRRGQIETGYMHTADWYTTFCSLVGVNHKDESAADAGLPPVDGLDMWPLISGEVSESPRNEILVSDTTLIIGDYKLMTGMIYKDLQF